MAEGASLALDRGPMFDGINDRLWEDCQAFISRDLAEVQVEYLFRRVPAGTGRVVTVQIHTLEGSSTMRSTASLVFRKLSNRR